ncbi:hypothetical protein B484DRAFT_450122 [Ochromonadaceae sp. CCMP2298]|nr:hypothetical protein B484DRAFT_450122 [Ochromonadaceae sp. CCMP2298]
MESMITKLDTDSIGNILSFCAADGLCGLSQASRIWSKFLEPLMEGHWDVLCTRRWQLDEKMRRVIGACTMKDAYHTLDFRRRIPKGRFTEKFNYVFGSGRAGVGQGLSAWVLLGHTSNAKLRRLSPTKKVIGLRLCVQNTSAGLLSLDLSDTSSLLSVLALPGDDDDAERAGMTACNFRLIARNGKISNSAEKECHLAMLDFVVISCDVLCPEKVEFETDWLAMVSDVQVAAHDCLPCAPHSPRARMTATCKLLEEDEIWNYYDEVVTGVILLRDRPLTREGI